MSRVLSRDEKLEQIMRLREYQKNNTSQVNTMAGIVSPNTSYKEEDMQNQDQTGIPNKVYGKLRLVLSILLFGILFLYHVAMEPEDGTLIKNLQAAVRTDYSDQVIDFVEDFTYTLDYEKTGIN